MFRLMAPHPLCAVITVLPNPTWSDSEALTDEVTTKRAMDGTARTYVKTKNQRCKLQWQFRMTRNKSLELRAFISVYFATMVKVVDHNEVAWIGHFMNNPFEFEVNQRAAPAIAPMPRGETVVITIEFEGVREE